MSAKTTESKQGYGAALAKANKFDPGALPANRGGKFSSRQQTKLYLALGSTFLSSFLGIVFGILLIITGLVWFPKEEPLSEWIMIIASILAILVGLWWIFEGGKNLRRSWWPLLKDIRGDKIVSEKGQVKKKYDDQYYKSMWHRLLTLVFSFISDSDERYSSDLFSGTHFYLLKEDRFIVSQKGYNALNVELAHVLYFTPNSKKLINIEPVSQKTA